MNEPEKLEEPMYRILRAQANNIARIETDLVLPGTTGSGDQIKVFGPRPNIIRLYDTPLRFMQDGVLENWERIITLGPLLDAEAGRIAGRNDRDFRYQIQMLVRLTEREIMSDREQVVVNALRSENPLAQKIHRLLYDFHHVFYDDHQLQTEDCPQGLVDDQGYTSSWDAEVEYPFALVVIEVAGTRTAW